MPSPTRLRALMLLVHFAAAAWAVAGSFRFNLADMFFLPVGFTFPRVRFYGEVTHGMAQASGKLSGLHISFE